MVRAQIDYTKLPISTLDWTPEFLSVKNVDSIIVRTRTFGANKYEYDRHNKYVFNGEDYPSMLVKINLKDQREVSKCTWSFEGNRTDTVSAKRIVEIDDTTLVAQYYKVFNYDEHENSYSVSDNYGKTGDLYRLNIIGQTYVVSTNGKKEDLQFDDTGHLKEYSSRGQRELIHWRKRSCVSLVLGLSNIENYEIVPRKGKKWMDHYGQMNGQFIALVIYKFDQKGRVKKIKRYQLRDGSLRKSCIEKIKYY
jgi:hypothetical protein